MVFEEFFFKKKIDLVQLQNTEPNLFNEFKNHYSLMGEKSFDHTKKYWFNRLRHSYPLSEEEQARLKEYFKSLNAPPGSEEEKTPTATSTEIAAATPKPAGFTPKFRATAKPAEQAKETPAVNSEEKAPETPAPAPQGFKPRFKTGLTKPAESETAPGQESTPPDEKPKSTVKPAGFKPRFKPGTTPSVQATDTSLQNESTEPVGLSSETLAEKEQENIQQSAKEEAPTASVKPLGFKPRFKAGSTPTTQNTEITKPVQEDKKETSEEKQTESPAPAATKPLGFKPRFKAGTTPVAQNTETEEKTAQEKQPKNTEEQQQVEKPAPAATKPLGFKPRSVIKKTVEDMPENIEPTEQTLSSEDKKEESTTETAPAKPVGFKPRMLKKKTDD